MNSFLTAKIIVPKKVVFQSELKLVVSDRLYEVITDATAGEEKVLTVSDWSGLIEKYLSYEVCENDVLILQFHEIRNYIIYYCEAQYIIV